MDVAALLSESLALHTQAREARRLKATNARALLEQARDKRMLAHVMDEQHADPAWQAEQSVTGPGRDTHAVMMAFYAQLMDG